jgi:hypothetical protein
MLGTRVFIGVAVSIVLGASGSFAAIETIPTKNSDPNFVSWSIPTLLKNQEFQLELYRSVQIIVDEPNFQIAVTNDALKECKLNTREDEKTNKLNLRTTLSTIAASVPKQVETNLRLSAQTATSPATPIRILIDYFPEESRYGSYLYSNEISAGIPALLTLGLDCRPSSQAQWIPRFAHEWVHVLFKFNQIKSESWFEEGIAQWIEDKLGGSWCNNVSVN